MIQPVTRLGDLTAGHDGFPPRPSITASPDVTCNNIPVVRVTDGYAIHCNAIPICHDGILAVGSPTVTVNNLPLGRVGDPVSCGDTVAEGSPDVLCG